MRALQYEIACAAVFFVGALGCGASGMGPGAGEDPERDDGAAGGPSSQDASPGAKGTSDSAHPTIEDRAGGGAPAGAQDGGNADEDAARAPDMRASSLASDLSFFTPQSADASPAPTAGSVNCGTTSCPLATSYCCANREGNTCRLRGVSCAEGSARRCDGPEDCRDGAVCCARIEPSSPGTYRSECREQNDCDPSAQLCHAHDQCPTGYKCCSIDVNGTSLSVCRQAC
jgi:hypothetical protein